jgi:hypothetical protein
MPGQRKPEQLLNDDLMEALAGWDPRRVENLVAEGTPDINYIGGWIESKVGERPKRAATTLSLRHYTREQRGWHMRRCRAGGRVHVVLRVGDATMAIDAYKAAQHLGIDWTYQDCATNCAWMCAPWNPVGFRKFIEGLNRDRGGY